ncbi:MAG: hypothetical protein JWO15_3561 [Sphingomonadales bacterium]|nr:hypothetical protein [Sphingomonadales bacterium]
MSKLQDGLRTEDAYIKAELKQFIGISHNRNFIAGLLGALLVLGGTLFLILN